MQRIAALLALSICFASPCKAIVSTNVPLGHWSYDAVDRLASYGLIDGAMLTIKPITRVEMARHIEAAMVTLDRRDDLAPIVATVVDRLREEFRSELIEMGVLDGFHGGAFVKPVEDPYVRYLYARNAPDLENMRGDVFQRGSNYRLGFAARGRLTSFAGFYLHPEYGGAFSEPDRGLDLIEGYGKIMAGPYEVQIGRDSLWWGPGYRGSILMSNNAEPLTMIKVTNPQPIALPWLFRFLGPMRTEWFLTQLEQDRAIPNTKLSGIRMNFKPLPWLELGASRVVMFGGTGAPETNVGDYLKTFFAMSEQAENNQLAGVDMSLLIPLADLPRLRTLPLRSIKFYVDGAGEDEAGGLPSIWGALYGLQLNDLFKTGRTDFRFEYADNHDEIRPDVFYNHSLYLSGYTYKGRVIGHYMGTDTRQLFMQLSHYITEDLQVRFSYDHLTHNLSGSADPENNIYQFDLTYLNWRDWRIEAGYRYEDSSAITGSDNHIFQTQLTRQF